MLHGPSFQPYPGRRTRALGTFLGSVLLAGAAMAAPRLSVQNPDFDAGSVSRGEVVEATFVLRNTGDRLLRVLRADPG